MKLSKVVYLNLEAHKERDDRMRNWLKDAEVPDDRIVRYEGKDAAHYDSVEGIISAAVADGFPELNNLLDRSHPAIERWAKRGNVACAWAFRSMFRYVATQETDQACLVLIDDAQMLKPFSAFESVVEKAIDFDIIQFYNMVSRDDQKFDEHIQNMLTPTICSFDSRFIYGAPYTGEHGSVYSPEGARKMLEYLSRDGNQNIFAEAINWFPIRSHSYGGTWRLISRKIDTEEWIHRHPEESYRKLHNI